MTAPWAAIVLAIGNWDILLGFGVLVLVFLVATCAQTVVVRRQQTAGEVAVGIALVIAWASLAGLCALVAWQGGLEPLLAR